MKDMKIESVALYKCIRKLLSVIFLLPLFYACGSAMMQMYSRELDKFAEIKKEMI